jgi:hypothetical protein
MYIPRYVIDTNVINARGGVSGMDELERLHNLRVIEVLCTSTANVEITPGYMQEEKARKYRRIGSAYGTFNFAPNGGPDATWGAATRQSRIEEIHLAVFGTRYPNNNKEKHNIRSMRDALHLDQCWSNMVDVFITNDKTILRARPALRELGIDFRISNPEECVEFIRQCLRNWYGTVDDGEIEKAIRDLSRPIIIGSNKAAELSISIGEERPALGLQFGTSYVQVEAHFRDASGTPLLTILPNRDVQFHQRTVQIAGARNDRDVGLKLGNRFYDKCSIGSTAEDRPPFWSPLDEVLLAAFVARSGHIVFYAGILRDSKGNVRATITKECLELVDASLCFGAARE